jgi:hypothetical protein
MTWSFRCPKRIIPHPALAIFGGDQRRLSGNAELAAKSYGMKSLANSSRKPDKLHVSRCRAPSGLERNYRPHLWPVVRGNKVEDVETV